VPPSPVGVAAVPADPTRVAIRYCRVRSLIPTRLWASGDVHLADALDGCPVKAPQPTTSLKSGMSAPPFPDRVAAQGGRHGALVVKITRNRSLGAWPGSLC